MTCGRNVIAVMVLFNTLAQGCAHVGNTNGDEAEKSWDASSAVLYVWYGGDFKIRGTIRNANDGEAVPYAELTFVGAKLPTDYEGFAGRVGMADRNGVVDQVYSYNWCATLSAAVLGMDRGMLAGLDRDEVVFAFDETYTATKRIGIEIHKQGFEPFEAQYSLAELRSEEGLSVSLGDIELRPIEETPKT